jgi:acetoin:2,6-dichlorophenolindophenol oxidoreductase subunit beta
LLEARRLTYRAAVLEALFEEMRRDPAVIVMGEDVGAAGGVFKQTEGLLAEFGAARIIDTPISESATMGVAVGAAMTGLRPIVEIMFGDFVTLAMDQLVNQAAKIHYMSAGQFRVPLVLRTTMGIGANLGPQHSQSLYAWTAHVPGLKLAIPSTAYDAKGLFAAAIRDDNPVVIFEDRMLYGATSDIPAEPYLVPFGVAEIKRRGRDATVVAIGRMVPVALAAATVLAAEGIEVEIVDPRSIVPLDVETIVASVRRTSRALVVDGGSRQYGIAGEIAATIAEAAFDWLDAPVARLAGEDVPIPMSRSLERLMQPDEISLAARIRDLVAGR